MPGNGLGLPLCLMFDAGQSATPKALSNFPLSRLLRKPAAMMEKKRMREYE